MSGLPVMSAFANKDLLSIAQLSRQEIAALLATATRIKANPKGAFNALEGKVIVLLFEKDSLRTLVSFEAGVAKLGGKAVYLDHRTARIGAREPIKDYAKNLERWVDVIVARTYEHATIEELARHARIPVINALSDLEHPCQALADFLTLHEKFGAIEDVRLAYVGDGNNVCHSLILCAAVLGAHMTVITPRGFEPRPKIVERAQTLAHKSGAKLTLTSDLNAIANHHAVYADTWTSMGQESQAAERTKVFEPYQVTEKVMAMAGRDSVFMHCLPAHRGQEVTAEVIDGPRSVVYDQAENRMHAQNALLLHLLAPKSTHPHSSHRSMTVLV